MTRKTKTLAVQPSEPKVQMERKLKTMAREVRQLTGALKLAQSKLQCFDALILKHVLPPVTEVPAIREELRKLMEAQKKVTDEARLHIATFWSIIWMKHLVTTEEYEQARLTARIICDQIIQGKSLSDIARDILSNVPTGSKVIQ
jgi:hypothetical protein